MPSRNPRDPGEPEVRVEQTPEAPAPTTAGDAEVARDQEAADGDKAPSEDAEHPTVKSKQTSDKDVTVTLAHPMDVERAQRLGLDTDAALSPGTQVTLHRNYARGLINSGYVAIDPEDRDAVRAALSPAG